MLQDSADGSVFSRPRATYLVNLESLKENTYLAEPVYAQMRKYGQVSEQGKP
jgi:hypothetical protein